MYEKTITYEGHDGNEYTDTFNFNLDEAEMAELLYSIPGGWVEHMERISKPPVDGGALITTFKDLVRRSVGRRSEDGKRFDKDDQITKEFMNSRAYSVFFMELMNNPDTIGQEFVNAIMPRALVEKIAQEMPEAKKDGDPAWMTEGRVPKPEELVGATQAQLQEAFRRQTAAKTS